VLAESKCNSQKRDRLPSCDHPAAWAERNAQFGAVITSELERRGVIAELAVRADEMVLLAATRRDLIQPFSEM
jgi:hypothetical protein